MAGANSYINRFLMTGVIKQTTPPLSSFTNAVIVCDGNSLTAGGYGGGFTYPQLLQQQNPFSTNGAVVYNKGVAGQTTDNMSSDASTDIDTLYNPSVKNILIAWEVGNDIYYNGNVTNAVNNFKTYCLARKAVGWKVMVITLTPRNQTTGFGDTAAQFETKLQSANNLMLSTWPDFADAIIDIRDDVRLASINSTYFWTDEVHLVQAGNAVLVSMIMQQILLM